MARTKVLLQRFLHGLGFALLGLVGAVIIVGLLLALAPVRNVLISQAVRQAQTRLPGTLVVERASWPGLGSIGLTGFLWTQGADTLAAADTLTLEMDLNSLFHRYLHARRIEASGVTFDLPMLRAAFSPSSKPEKASPPSNKKQKFPRSGVLPGVPSLAAETVVLRVNRARFSPTWTIVATELEGDFDLSLERGPRLHLSRLTARGAGRRMEIQAQTFTVDGLAGQLAGELAARLDSLGTLTVHLSSTSDSLECAATLTPDGVGSSIRFLLHGRPTWTNQRLQSVAFRGELFVPSCDRLAGWPSPFGKAARLGLPPLTLHTDGDLSLRPRFSVEARALSKPSGWLEGLEVTGSYDASGVQIDTLMARVPGLRLAASGRRTDAWLEAIAKAEVTDGRWIQIVSPGFDPPESLAVGIRASVQGPPRNPALIVDLEGGVRKKSWTLSQVKIGGRFPQGLALPGTVEVSAVTRGIRVHTRAELIPRLPLEATLSPIQVEDLKVIGNNVIIPPHGNGRIHYDPGPRRVRVDSVQIFGDWGTGNVDGDLAGGSGTATMAWQFPQLPALLHRVITLPDSSWQQLRERWQVDGPFGFEAKARFEHGRVTGEGEVALPGPGTLRALLPRGAQLEDLGTLHGRFEGSVDSVWSAMLDVSPTSWLEATPLRIRGSRAGMAVDSLRVGMEGWTLSAGGARQGGIWDAHGELDLEDASLLRRFVPSWTDHDSCSASIRADVRGRAPDLSLALQAKGRYHAFRVQNAVGHISRSDGRWNMKLSALGLRAGTRLELDHLTAELATEEGGRGTMRLECAGPTMSLATRGLIDRADGLSATVDTLGLSLNGKDLHTAHAFRLAARANHQGYHLDDLDLQGTMGSLTGQGDVRPGASQVDVRMTLDLEGLSPPSAVVATWWPEHLDVSIQNEGMEALSARAAVEGVRLGGRADYSVEMTARGDASGLRGEVHLREPEGEALSARYFSPGTWQLYPLRIQVTPQRLEAQATLHALPIPWEDLGLESSQIWPGTVSGSIQINHDDTGPFARTDLEATLTSPDPKERPVRFTTQAVWLAASSQMARVSENETTPLLETTEERLRAMDGPGLVASFDLARDAASQLTGSVFARFREMPNGTFVIDPDHGLDVTTTAPRLDLATFRPFLPPGYALAGNLSLDLHCEGPPANPTLSGTLDAPKVVLDMDAGGRIAAKGRLEYSGTLLAPKILGRIDIQSGLIPIPEEPRKLHPASGNALLWPSRTPAAPVPDSTVSDAHPNPAGPDSTGRFRPVYDLQIVVPSGFWIRGRNLNVELEGDLRLRQQQGLPTMVGTLEARQGTLAFLGRSFELERGKVQFYGEDENNPSLDIRLTAKVSSTTVYVTMTGTAREPELELTSSPSMTEGDIMSLLVMGKTSDDLNGDQAELVAQRAAAIAATYGAAELQKKAAGPLGVDMITLNPGGGPEGENSVVVGKYLSPRALLKYEQALDSAAGFFVTLQYTLTKTITIETIAGTWQSGAEISWSKDY
jgi:TamB, inner membrane protein subunit of TAM complex